MFGLGMGEVLVLAVLGLILIGPEQLPELARTLGRFINDLKRTTDGLTEDIKKQAKVDIDLDFMNPNKPKAKPFTEEEYKKLIQPPAEATVEINTSGITNPAEPHHGKKMTHNEFGELIIEAAPTPTTEAALHDDSNQLALFEEDPADKKNSNS